MHRLAIDYWITGVNYCVCWICVLNYCDYCFRLTSVLVFLALIRMYMHTMWVCPLCGHTCSLYVTCCHEQPPSFLLSSFSCGCVLQEVDLSLHCTREHSHQEWSLGGLRRLHLQHQQPHQVHSAQWVSWIGLRLGISVQIESGNDRSTVGENRVPHCGK